MKDVIESLDRNLLVKSAFNFPLEINVTVCSSQNVHFFLRYHFSTSKGLCQQACLGRSIPFVAVIFPILSWPMKMVASKRYVKEVEAYPPK